MGITRRIKRALRGEAGLAAASLEAARHLAVALRQHRERSLLSDRNGRVPLLPAWLTPGFAKLNSSQLLAYFRERQNPRFFNGFYLSSESLGEFQRECFANETDQLLKIAEGILAHRWPLLGYGEIDFGQEIDWLREPVSGIRWPSDYQGDIQLVRGDGSDIRVLWELNRLGHFVTLGRAFALTRHESLAEEFLHQLETWRKQNPFGFGPNWICAMEVSLRAINLIAAMQMFLYAGTLTEKRFADLLLLLAQHGEYIRRHLEFSYLATSNHYLCDVAGLLWLGLMLPELQAANEWRQFGLRELLREMDKQVLADGADYEASTGYHRLKTELFLLSFVLCRVNEIKVPETHWNKLKAMIEYERACLRPDGKAPLIGDADSSRVMPLVHRPADDHAYLLALGAALFSEPGFKIAPARQTPELLWLLGEQGVRDYKALRADETAQSRAFPDAGTYVLRDHDLYLLFNTSGNGMNGRGSHGHNDALAIEVSACGAPFIVDPGTYVYTADLEERHRFRSTAYHSTVQVDDTDQNATVRNDPFVMGDEAHPRVLRCEFSDDLDLVAAEHKGYSRLSNSVTHQRVVRLDKTRRVWKIIDSLPGAGDHSFRFVFGLAPEVETVMRADGVVQLRDKMSGAQLLLAMLDRNDRPEFVSHWTSHDYGARSQSQAAVWSIQSSTPLVVRWAIVPVCKSDDESSRVQLIEEMRREAGVVNFGIKA